MHVLSSMYIYIYVCICICKRVYTTFIPPTNDHLIAQNSWKNNTEFKDFPARHVNWRPQVLILYRIQKDQQVGRCGRSRQRRPFWWGKRCGEPQGAEIFGIFVKVCRYLSWRFASFWKYWNTSHHLDVELVEQQTGTATHQEDYCYSYKLVEATDAVRPTIFPYPPLQL